MVGQPGAHRTFILVLALFMVLGPAVLGTLRTPSPIVNPARQSSVNNPAH